AQITRSSGVAAFWQSKLAACAGSAKASKPRDITSLIDALSGSAPRGNSVTRTKARQGAAEERGSGQPLTLKCPKSSNAQAHQTPQAIKCPNSMDRARAHPDRATTNPWRSAG